MWSWLQRWLLRVLIGLAAVLVAAYAVDWSVYHVRGAPQSSVTVNRYMSVPLKGQKEEYDFLGTAVVPCAEALFPQGDEDPCWLLRRNPNKWEHL
ncbi:MAG TPA: hypothetical protein VMA34_08065 [Terracidiphilus sp.]|nr:hypothetical protein [Terracidiphilus sp.]